MSGEEQLDQACRDETAWAVTLHADAADYVAGDLTPEQFLAVAYQYGKARLERERMQAELWR